MDCVNEMIKDKVVVITGESSGLGEKTAIDLAALGAKVVLGARRLNKLDDIIKTIKENGGTAFAIETDVTQASQVRNLVQTAVNVYGKIDVLINNAGIMPEALLEKLHIEEWNQTIEIGRAHV